jgi:hypothetical protein
MNWNGNYASLILALIVLILLIILIIKFIRRKLNIKNKSKYIKDNIECINTLNKEFISYFINHGFDPDYFHNWYIRSVKFKNDNILKDIYLKLNEHEKQIYTEFNKNINKDGKDLLSEHFEILYKELIELFEHSEIFPENYFKIKKIKIKWFHYIYFAEINKNKGNFEVAITYYSQALNCINYKISLINELYSSLSSALDEGLRFLSSDLIILLKNSDEKKKYCIILKEKIECFMNLKRYEDALLDLNIFLTITNNKFEIIELLEKTAKLKYETSDYYGAWEDIQIASNLGSSTVESLIQEVGIVEKLNEFNNYELSIYKDTNSILKELMNAIENSNKIKLFYRADGKINEFDYIIDNFKIIQPLKFINVNSDFCIKAFDFFDEKNVCIIFNKINLLVNNTTNNTQFKIIVDRIILESDDLPF